MYSEDTSMEASIQFEGIFVVSINLRNSVECFSYEGRFLHVAVAIYPQIGMWVQ